MYKIWFARNYRAPVSNTLLLDNALATMGAGLPSAMMAAILYPQRRVLAVCGDGGFMMNSQEVETAVRLKLNLVVLILQDNAYGMIRWKQAVDDFPDFGLTFGNPDFVKYAEAYGATGWRVESTESWPRRCARHSTPAVCTWSPCPSTIPRMPGCWSTKLPTAFRLRRRCDCGDQRRGARSDGCRLAVCDLEAADPGDARRWIRPGRARCWFASRPRVCATRICR